MFKLKIRKISKKRMLILCSLLAIVTISSISLYRIFAARVNGSSYTASSISGDTVYVNDLDSDWNYYNGLNYTEVTSKTVLPGENTNKYNQNSLVAVKIVYDGRDVNKPSLVGNVSSTEKQSKFVYYKYYPIVNNKVKIELIDNPFTARPTNYGFNGWVCDKEATDGIACSDLTFSYDDNYYLRYVTLNKPDSKDADGNYKVVINLRASWVEADVRTSISGARDFDDKSMQQVKRTPIIQREPVYAKNYYFKSGLYYFTKESARRNQYYTGITINNNSTYGTNGYYRCNNRNGCQYWKLVDTNYAYNTSKNYYVGDLAYGDYYQNIRETTDNDFDIVIDKNTILGYEDTIVGYENYKANDDDSMGGYYYKTNYTSNNSDLYYNDKGISCSETNCYYNMTVYKLIQSGETETVTYNLKNDEKYADGYDENVCTTSIDKWKNCKILTPKLDADGNKVYETNDAGEQQLVYEEKEVSVNNVENYYYLVTRDLNILSLSSGNGLSLNGLSLSVPYTVSGNYDGKGNNNVTLTTSGTLTANDDMVIENLKFSGLRMYNDDDRPTNSYINANYYNLKIGRGVDGNTTSNMVAYGVVPGNSNGSNKKNKVIVESGHYTYLKTMATSNGTNESLISQYGSDYDRVTNNNNNLIVEFQALASDRGNHNSTLAAPTSQMIVKSGTMGNRMINGDKSTYYVDYYTYGIYVGGIAGGSSNSFRTLRIEGGRIYTINGGPCITADHNVGNVIGIYMTGGVVDTIVGGAGRSLTYGNRIVSVTGGTINHNIFGGSNSFQGSQSDGQLYGDTLIYVGGDATIGDATNNLYNAIPGNVYGAGAGRPNQGNIDYSSLGNVNSAHVIINGGDIKGNVYGGGNYGSTGKMDKEGTETNIDVLNGTIEGSVFGSSKENGSGMLGDAQYVNKASVYYYMGSLTYNAGDTIPSTYSYFLYNGKAAQRCEASGTCSLIKDGVLAYNNSNNNSYVGEGNGSWTKYTYQVYHWNDDASEAKAVKDGEVCSTDSISYKNGRCYVAYQIIPPGVDTNIYDAGTCPNGYCPYYLVDFDSPGFTDGRWHLPNDVEETFGVEAHTININLNGGTILDSVYGGSDNGGTVYANVNINAKAGSVTNSVFGAGYGKNTYVSGSVKINVDGDFTAENVYGGSALGVTNGAEEASSDTTQRTVDVIINSGTITNVYGGSKGDQAVSPPIYGPITVTVNGGTITNLFGGNDANGTASMGSTVYLKGGTITNAFGGSNLTGFDTTKIYEQGSTVENIFGGSNQSGTVNKTNVYLEDGTATNVYGGNNAGGQTTSAYVSMKGGSLNNVYGCGKGEATSCNDTLVSINGYKKDTTNVYGGGEAAGVLEKTIVHLKSGTIANLFGGSNSGGTVVESNIYITDGSVVNVYGGNNAGGETTTTNVEVGNDATAKINSVYGGGKSVDSPTTNVDIYKGTIADVYGSGENGSSAETNVYVHGGNVDRVFGGSFKGDNVLKTNVFVDPTVKVSTSDGNSSGGDSSSSGGNNTDTGTDTDGGGTFESTYQYKDVKFIYEIKNISFNRMCDPNNESVSMSCGYTYTGNVSLKVENPYNVNITSYNIVLLGSSNYYIGENTSLYYYPKILLNRTNSYLYESNGACNTSQAWCGWNSAYTINANSTTDLGSFQIFFNKRKFSLRIDMKENVDPKDLNKNPEPDNGGNKDDDKSGATDFVKPTFKVADMNVDSVYGGNNESGRTTTSNVQFIDGTVKNVYGGNNAGGETTNANVLVKKGTILENLYGGGNDAVTNNTKVSIEGGTINGSAFGGGNSTGGVVNDSTDISIKGGIILQNAFGGGNAANVAKVTKITLANGEINGSLFGSGNSAQTGLLETDSASSIVNFLGGTVKKNVYGGANTSIVYGYTFVNIGENNASNITLSDYKYDKKINIGGTIFGGGESKTENNDNYTFDFKSVTKGIEVSLDATDYEIDFTGSIFGSGNASSSKGTSDIYITNLGSEDKIQTFTSIQRTDNVYLKNCHIQLLGTTDRTLPRPDYIYSLSKIANNLYMLDSTEMYLKQGANETHGIYSGYYDDKDDIQKEYVKIDDAGKITSKKGDNKIYMAMDKKLNVLIGADLLPENAGNVSGMAFLGMYVPVDGNATSFKKGIYDTKYQTGDTLDNDVIELLKYSGTYVYGKHYTNHDITVDGYYSNFVEDNSTELNVNYVGVTPENAKNYYWAIGVQLTDYEVKLYASELTTEGVKNAALDRQSSNADMKLTINSVQYNELNSNIKLVPKENIKMVADSNEIADTTFGLSFGTSDSGWKNVGMTDLYTSAPLYDGTTEYQKDSNGNPPTLSFYLYYSKNIRLEEDESERNLGYVSIKMTAETPNPDDDLDVTISYIEVKVRLFIRKDSDQGYSSAITPGKKYDVFPQMKTNISSNGALSIYHNLFVDLNGLDANDEQWSKEKIYPEGSYRALVSDYVYPVGTTITMLDLTENEYYYYTIDEDRYKKKLEEYNQQNEVSYRLSDFVKMASMSSDNNYNDSVHNEKYYHAGSSSSDNGCAAEEFIFMLDFANGNVVNNVQSKFYLELRNKNDRVILAPKSSQAANMEYKIYTDKDALLTTEGTLSTNVLYVGDSALINLQTKYTQASVDDVDIYDSTYDEYKLGSTISIYDKDGNMLDGSSLLGVTFTLNGKDYYPQTHGIVRIPLAGKVSNVNSKLTINTANSNLTSGEYTIKIETFGSYDGIYSSNKKSEPLLLNVLIKNNQFGLDVKSEDVMVTHDKTTGADKNGDNKIDFHIVASSGLTNPDFRVSLQRRSYTSKDDAYEMSYENVDLADYVIDSLEIADTEKYEYYISKDSVPEQMDYSLTLKDTGLKSGTYRIVFSVYDDGNYIGSVYRYLIIRDM